MRKGVNITTRTENYQLPQWAANDPVKREDFNDAMEKIDTGIATVGHVVGTYLGNGLAMADGGQLIDIGFQPRFLIISRGWTGSSGPYFLAVGTVRIVTLADTFTFEPNGFRVAIPGTGTLNLNASGYTFTYIAFR